MPTFIYTAKDKSGTIQKGDITAISKQEAARLITSKEFTPITILEKKSIRNLLSLNNTLSYVPRVEKVVFFRQLATLINAGISLTQALNILQKGIENKKMNQVVLDVLHQVEGGINLSKAMSNYEKIFGVVFISMIEAGEIGGTLDKSLENIADQIEKDHELIAKIRSAMTYPVVIIVAMFGAIYFMMTNIIPELGKMFQEMGAELPTTTKLLISISNSMSTYGIGSILGLVALYFGFRTIMKRVASFKKAVHFLLLKIPVLGQTIKKINYIRFTRTLGSLLDSGVSIVETLEIITKSTRNILFREAIESMKEKVRNGSPLSKAMEGTKMFPILIPQMLSVGEESGALSNITTKISVFYEKEVDNTIKNLTSLLEPVLMIMIGTMIGFIMISIIKPIYELTNMF